MKLRKIVIIFLLWLSSSHYLFSMEEQKASTSYIQFNEAFEEHANNSEFQVKWLSYLLEQRRLFVDGDLFFHSEENSSKQSVNISDGECRALFPVMEKRIKALFDYEWGVKNCRLFSLGMTLGVPALVGSLIVKQIPVGQLSLSSKLGLAGVTLASGIAAGAWALWATEPSDYQKKWATRRSLLAELVKSEVGKNSEKKVGLNIIEFKDYCLSTKAKVNYLRKIWKEKRVVIEGVSKEDERIHDPLAAFLTKDKLIGLRDDVVREKKHLEDIKLPRFTTISQRITRCNWLIGAPLLGIATVMGLGGLYEYGLISMNSTCYAARGALFASIIGMGVGMYHTRHETYIENKKRNITDKVNTLTEIVFYIDRIA